MDNLWLDCARSTFTIDWLWLQCEVDCCLSLPWQPGQTIKLSPAWTAAEAAAAAAGGEAADDGTWSAERRMRRLFETASALRRRHVYATARRQELMGKT